MFSSSGKPSAEPPHFRDPVNEVSITHLYKSHYARLVLFAKKLLNDSFLAEDFVADGFLKLWCRREKMQSQAYPRAFLFMVIRNACLNHLRNTQRRERISQNSITLPDIYEIPFEEYIFYKEIWEQIFHASVQLPPKMHEVYSLLYIEGLSVTEVAHHLSIHVNTVCSHRSDLLKKLKQVLEKKAIL